MQESLKLLPNSPGVYRFFDTNGRLLYVGKAKSLKNRVKSYFKFTPIFEAANDISPRIAKMLSEAVNIEWSITACEADALTLENSLIKSLHPKYNILLRDDKTYPYIVVDYASDYPRLEITRKTLGGGQKKYYGPFVGGARDLLNAIYEKFPLVQKSSCAKGKKACLFYQINRCLAPCQFSVDKSEYRAIVDNAVSCMFDKKPLLDFLENKMQSLAQNERFEEAAQTRDMYITIKNMSVQSGVDLAKNSAFDVIVVHNEGDSGVIIRLFVRGGKIVSISQNFIKSLDATALDEVYTSAILDFYRNDLVLETKEIVLGHELEDIKTLQEILQSSLGQKITISCPKKGEKKAILDFAFANAAEALRKLRDKVDISKKLAELFGFDFAPIRIETFDASHIGGKNPVAAMVVWDNGGFSRQDYRTYHVEGTDEYSQMREILTRRALDFEKNPPPDMWLIDGGEAQRKLAKEIIDSSGAFVNVVAIAKAKKVGRAQRAKGLVADRIFYDGNELKLPSSDARLQFMQRLRDESHRFVLDFGRKIRVKETKQIEVMKETGIKVGIVSKLISALGSFEAVSNASLEELSAIVGEKYAQKVFEFYAKS